MTNLPRVPGTDEIDWKQLIADVQRTGEELKLQVQKDIAFIADLWARYVGRN